MSEVFDEDLMRELGIDPKSFTEGQEPAKKPVKPATPRPQPQPHDAAGDKTQITRTPPPPPRPKAPVAATELDDDEEPRPRPAQPAPAARPAAAKIEEPRGQDALTDDIPVNLAAVLARKSVKLKDVVNLKAGEIIEFKKLPQDPLDLVANGKLIAKAELVLVDGKVGLRITKLM